MINRVCGNSPTVVANKNIKPKSMEPSFGVAYHIDTTPWYRSFDKTVEQDFISKAINEIKGSKVAYLGTDGIIYKFKTANGEFVYGKEAKGYMSNLKFIPNNNNEGYYIIDNGASSETSRKYNALADVLDKLIQKSRTALSNYYDPRNIKPNSHNTASSYYQQGYLRDNTPRGMRSAELQAKPARTPWPSERRSSRGGVIVRMGDMAR